MKIYKETQIMNRAKKKSLIELNVEISAIIFFLAFIMFSCRSTDSDSMQIGGVGLIEVNLQEESFEDNIDIGMQASFENKISHDKPLLHKKEIPFNDNFTLIAELSAGINQAVKTQVHASGKARAVAGKLVTALKRKIKYKLVVYKSNGEYVTERNYTVGQANSTESLTLDGGADYTFIAYSINSTTDLPALTFGTSGRTLVNSNINGLEGATDFMYYRKDMRVSNGRNYLNIVLSHLLSQITTTIDVSASGYNVTAITASIDSQHYSLYNVSLKDGFVTNRTGAAGSVKLVFPYLGAFGQSKVVSNPIFTNGKTTAGKFTILSMKVGSINKVNLDILSNMEIIPGVKYNLSLKLNPVDKYIDDYNGSGHDVAVINGKAWMRYNLGAYTSLDPDINPSIKELHGNYYQWGWKEVVANANSTNGNIGGWYGENSNWGGDNAWNLGTEKVPVKTTNDPCPNGFRIPTKSEFESLISSTTQTNIGNWTESSTNFSSAKVFTSKRNKNVRLTLPTAGFRESKNGNLFSPEWGKSRGAAGYYRTSNSIFALNFTENQLWLASDKHKSWGESIRCVAV